MTAASLMSDLPARPYSTKIAVVNGRRAVQRKEQEIADQKNMIATMDIVEHRVMVGPITPT
jgi:hypothetical protein